MIDKDGNIRCNGCGKKLAEHLEGKIEIVCPRCKRYNLEVVTLDKTVVVG